jgi:hypothetical protein
LHCLKFERLNAFLGIKLEVVRGDVYCYAPLLSVKVERECTLIIRDLSQILIGSESLIKDLYIIDGQ